MSARSPQPSESSADILTVIAERYDQLRKSERKVASVVLDQPATVLSMKVADLAAVAGVSEPTVIRLVTAVGCHGFPDLRLRLAQTLALGVPATNSVITPEDDVASVVSKVFDYSITSLDHSRRHLDIDRVAEAVEALANARSILFLGLGASGIVALDAEQKFPLFGVPCSAPTDHHQQFLAASVAGLGTAVVAISNTGGTTTVIEAVRIAREAGAVTIGLSGGQTPLLEHCDIPLVVEALDNTELYTPTISRLGQLALIDVLATSVALTKPETDQRRLQSMKAALSQMRRAGLPPPAASTDQGSLL